MPVQDVLVSASLDGAIDRAVEKLLAGELVCLPTETVYGLAADATNPDAVAKIYKAKGRPSFNPLICHVHSEGMAEQLIDLSDTAKRLTKRFWPGPLTIVSHQNENCSVAPAVSAGLETLAVRCPANEVARSVIQKTGRPLAAPSANISGRLSPTRAEPVLDSLGHKVGLILDDGPTEVGIESTIVAVDGDTITLLRPGTITVDEISEVADTLVQDRDKTVISAPGQLSSHYAPEARVSLNQTTSNGRKMLGFADIEGDWNLSTSGDLAEAAANLFEYLRQADDGQELAVAPIPNTGIGIAINDRLKRAAAERPEVKNDR